MEVPCAKLTGRLNSRIWGRGGGNGRGPQEREARGSSQGSSGVGEPKRQAAQQHKFRTAPRHARRIHDPSAHPPPNTFPPSPHLPQVVPHAAALAHGGDDGGKVVVFGRVGGAQKGVDRTEVLKGGGEGGSKRRRRGLPPPAPAPTHPSPGPPPGRPLTRHHHLVGLLGHVRPRDAPAPPPPVKPPHPTPTPHTPPPHLPAPSWRPPWTRRCQ
jgi:hypothetical protein